MPLPTFSQDDVVNFMVTEALVLRANEQRQDAELKRKQEDWKEEWKKNPPKGV